MLSLHSKKGSSPMRPISKKKKPVELYGALYSTSGSMDDDLIFTDDGSEDALLDGTEEDPLLESFRRTPRLSLPVFDDEEEDGHDDHNNDKVGEPKSKREQGGRSVTSSMADLMADPDQVGTASIASEVMSITKNLLGAGVLSLSEGIATYSNDPAAMLSATAWVVLLGGMFGYFCLLIAKICHKTRSATYRECWENTMGDTGGLAVSLVNALLPAQGILSATTVLSQTLQSLLQTLQIYWSRVTCLLVLTIVVLLPMCLTKDLNSISPFSAFGVVSMGVATIAMMIRYADGSYQPGAISYSEIDPEYQPLFGHETELNAKVLPFVCMVFNSYIMHYNTPRFYMELKDRSIPRFTLSIAWSFGLTAVILILIAGSGFLTFGEHSSSYILNNYSPNDPLATASRIGVFFSTLLMYPLTFFGVRDGILDVFGVPHYLQTTRNLDIVSVLVLCLLTVGAVFFHDLGMINAVGGGALATFLCVIFPSIMYRKLVVTSADSTAVDHADSWVALLLMVVGIILGISGVYQSFI